MGSKVTESWTKESLSASLKHLLKESGRTMADMSRTLGISFTTVSDWVNGRKYPRPENLDRLANYFGISTTLLLNLDDPTVHPAGAYLGNDLVLSLLTKGYTIDLQFNSADLDFYDLTDNACKPEEKYLITDSRTMDGVVLNGGEIRAFGGNVEALIKHFAEYKKSPDTLIDIEGLSEDRRYLVEKIIALSDDRVHTLRSIIEQIFTLADS